MISTLILTHQERRAKPFTGFTCPWGQSSHPFIFVSHTGNPDEPFHFSPQRPVSATRSSDRELRPFARLRFWPAFKRSTGSCSSKVVRRRSLTREGRCARRVTSRCRERARAQRRTREQDSFPLHLCLTHSLWLRAAVAGSNEPPPPSRLAPQAGPSLSPPASSRRRLARSRPRPASSRRRLASRRAFALLASRRRRQPVFSHSRRRGRQVSEAGIEPSARVVRTTAPQGGGEGGGGGGPPPPGAARAGGGGGGGVG